MQGCPSLQPRYGHSPYTEPASAGPSSHPHPLGGPLHTPTSQYPGQGPPGSFNYSTFHRGSPLHGTHTGAGVSQSATPTVSLQETLSQATQLLAALRDATGAVVNANGKRSRRQPKSTPAAKRARTRGQPAQAAPIVVNPIAPTTDTVTGPGPDTANQSYELPTPQPLQRFGSITQRLHKDVDGSLNASDVWYNLYFLEAREEPAVPLDNQPRRRTNPLGGKPCPFTHVACRFCKSWQVWKLTNGMTSTYRQHFENYHYSEWRETVIEHQLKGWEGLAFKVGVRQGKNADTGHGLAGASLEPFTLRGLARKIAHWVAAEDQAVSAVESPFFRDIIIYSSRSPQPLDDASIPHRTYIHDLIVEEYEGEIEDLRDELQRTLGRISFTSDLWSCQILDGYMSITLHYCARDKHSKRVVLRSRLGAFRHVLGAHTGENLAAHFIAVIEELGVLHKIGCITLDNASNCNTMMEHLERILTEKGIPFHRDGNRIRCFPHIVNIAVKHGLTAMTDVEEPSDSSNLEGPSGLGIHGSRLDSDGFARFSENSETSGLPDIVLPWVDRIYDADANTALQDPKNNAYADALRSDPVKKARTLVTACRASIQRREALREVIRELNSKGNLPVPLRVVALVKDVDTRWSATFLMIDRLLELYPAVKHFMHQPKQAEIKSLLLTEKELEVLADVRDFLHLPHRVQELLSSEQTPTVSVVVPAYEDLLDLVKLAAQRWPNLAHAIQATANALEQYMAYTRTTRVYALAVLLNPGFKKTWMETHWTSTQTAEAHQWLVEAMLGYRKALRSAPLTAVESAQAVDVASATPQTNSPCSESRLLLNQSTHNTPSQPISRTPSGFSLLSESIRRVTHPNAHAAAAQRQGFNFLSDIRRDMLKNIPVGSRTDLLHPTRDTGPFQEPAEEKTPEERQQRVDAEDLAAVTKEIEHYYAQGQLEQYRYNPLLYWEEFEQQFPILFHVAVDILPIPASSVASERVFSSGKETDTLRRTSLAPALFEILQVMKFSLKSRVREQDTGRFLAREGELDQRDISLTPDQVRDLFTGDNREEVKLLLRELVQSASLPGDP